jgi:hypothetical protein
VLAKWCDHANAFHMWVKCQPSHINVIIKNAIVLNIIHNVFNLCDTEVVICIILVLLKRAAYGLNHYLNIRYYILYTSPS